MVSRAGTGESRNRDSAEAAREATDAALEALGGPADVVLAFATVGHDQRALIDTIRAAAGSAPICGCSGAGVITRSGSSEGTHALGVMALRSSALRFTPMLEEGLARDPEGVGARIGARVSASEAPRLLLLFPDGLTGNATALLRGIARTAPPGVPVFGGGAGELMRFERTFQYGGAAVASDAVSALLVEGDATFDLAVSHGCRTLPIEHVVTRAEGGTVYELDGRPAWHVLREYIDDPRDTLPAGDVPHLCLASRIETEDGPLDVIRVPLGLDPVTGSLFFPGELRQGDTLSMARRDTDQVVTSAVQSARGLVAQRRGRDPFFVLQADCAGRGRLLFGEAVTERSIVPVQDAFSPSVPWLGFHCYGEIAPLGGEARYHNYTLALCAAYDGISR